MRTARSALSAVEYSRRQVIAEIDMPPLVLARPGRGMDRTRIDRRRRPRVDGCDCDADIWLPTRRRRRTCCRAGASGFVERAGELAGTHVSALVITFLVGLVALTIAAALLIDADGDAIRRSPVSLAAIAVALGGPELMAAVRRRALRNVAL